MTVCEHPSTVEIYKGIFKCSNCGDVWDEATDDEKADRQVGLAKGRRMQTRRQARDEYFRRRRYKQ